MTLGQRLRILRAGQSRRLKDQEVVSVPYLSDIERDKVSPSLDVIRQLAESYGMTTVQLLDGVDGHGTTWTSELEKVKRELKQTRDMLGKALLDLSYHQKEFVFKAENHNADD